MKKFTFLLLAAITCMNPMCSGPSLECSDKVIYNEYVEAGSFVYKYENKPAGNNYLRIEIITNGVKTKKTIKPAQMKKVLVDGKEMWATSPVFIIDRSQVIVYFVSCEYLY